MNNSEGICVSVHLWILQNIYVKVFYHVSVEKSFPTFKGDGCHRSFVSQYGNTYQGAWSRAAQPVEKVTQQQQQSLRRQYDQISFHTT